MKAIQTTASVNAAARKAQKSAVLALAESHPGQLATRLAIQPQLANGLSDLDYIVDALINAGFTHEVSCMLDSKALRPKERKIISHRLLISKFN